MFKFANYKPALIISYSFDQFFNNNSLKCILSNKLRNNSHIRSKFFGIDLIFSHMLDQVLNIILILKSIQIPTNLRAVLTQTKAFCSLQKQIFLMKIIIMINQRQQQQKTQSNLPINSLICFSSTIKSYKSQIQIVKKCIKSLYWKKVQNFPQTILYRISAYAFCNPIKFKTPIFKQTLIKRIKSQNSYILINDFLSSKLKEEQKTYSITVKVIKIWKRINVNQNDLNQIIMKSKHLMNFFNGLSIFNFKQRNKNIDQDDFTTVNKNWQKQKKSYNLICQNHDYIFQKISQIQANKKTHKIDQLILKTYLQMMKKNIIILSVQANTHMSEELVSEGKFIYFQNNLKLPLKNRKYEPNFREYDEQGSFKIKDLPFLKFQENSWFFEWKNQEFQLYQELYKKLDRGKGVIVNFRAQKFFYDDFKIEDNSQINYNQEIK